MALFPWLTERVCEPEVMDDPNLDRKRHFDALRGLTRLNGLSFSAQILWRPILRLARQCKLDKLRVLDVATGAGDLPIRLWKMADRAKLKLEIHGVDISSQALDFAKLNAANQGAPIQFSELNVLRDDLPQGYDVVISSLFFHHLEEQQAAALLQKMAGVASSLVLINDLRRCLRGWVLAHAAARTFTSSDVVHFDAPASVRAAYTIHEMRRLAISVGLNNVRITARWPSRFLLEWHRRS